MSTGMGRAPITWTEIDAYKRCSGYDLSGWECEQIIMMSRHYLSMYHEATEQPYLMPDHLDYQDVKNAMRGAVAKQFKAIKGS